MTASLRSVDDLDTTHLQQLLDDAEVQRTRLNRRIRRIRDLIRAVESGDRLPDLEAILALAQPEPAESVAEVPAPRTPTPAPTPQLVRPDGAPYSGALGPGMPPGVLSPGPTVGGPLAPMPSVDVGHLRRMSPEALDQLPFGVVTLDAHGRIVGYNDTESRMAGLPREAVLGRRFFGEVAPCAAVREFEGRFRDFASGRSRLALETFEFVFHFRDGAQHVRIMISPARQRGRFYVSMVRR